MEGTILTQAGKAELLNAPLLQKEVHWTTIVVGDGNGSKYIPEETQTELKNQVWSGAISDIREVAKGHLEFHTIIPADVGPFIIREAGILNEAGVLVAVCPVEEQNKVSITGSSGTINDMDFIIGALVDNAEVINVTVDPNTVIASREYVEHLFEEFKLSLKEMDKDDVERVFQMQGGGSGGYPDDWIEATEDDIDALFNS